MSFINMGKNLDDVPEEEAVPGDQQYDLTVVNVKDPYVKEDSGNTVCQVALRIEDSEYPNAKLVNHALVFPNPDLLTGDKDDKAKANLMLRGVKRFLTCFNVPWGEEGFEEEDLQGAQGKCLLVQEEYEGEINNKLRLPRVR